jgi:hypothetical protein|tara:strand:+ start:350 stop:529 length:180 start_codon:yes stop_codon:yes gene_type:complete
MCKNLQSQQFQNPKKHNSNYQNIEPCLLRTLTTPLDVQFMKGLAVSFVFAHVLNLPLTY